MSSEAVNGKTTETHRSDNTSLSQFGKECFRSSMELQTTEPETPRKNSDQAPEGWADPLGRPFHPSLLGGDCHC